MLKLDCNNLRKKEYQKYLSELFFNNEDYVQELSDYAYFRFTDWVDFIFSKYSLDKVLEQSELYNHSYLRELCFLAVHGLLHLLGYDHMKKDEEEVMFKKQEEILNEFGIKK